MRNQFHSVEIPGINPDSEFRSLNVTNNLNIKEKKEKTVFENCVSVLGLIV